MEQKDTPLIRRIVHDLTQPLTALQGSLELALHFRQNQDELQQNLLDAMEESARLSELMRAIRTWADSLQPFREPAPFSLQSWISDAVQQLHSLSHETTQRIFLEFDGPEFVLSAESPRLRAAFQQLIDFILSAGEVTDRISISVQTTPEAARVTIIGRVAENTAEEWESLLSEELSLTTLKNVPPIQRFRLCASARTLALAGGRCSSRLRPASEQMIIEILFAAAATRALAAAVSPAAVANSSPESADVAPAAVDPSPGESTT